LEDILFFSKILSKQKVYPGNKDSVRYIINYKKFDVAGGEG